MTTMRELTQEVKRLNEVITQLALEVGALKLQVAGMQQPTYAPNPVGTPPGQEIPHPYWPQPRFPYQPGTCDPVPERRYWTTY